MPVMHRRADDERVSFFFTTTRGMGDPQNMEPARCSDLSWFTFDRLPANMVPCVLAAVALVHQGGTYSEFGW